MNGLRLHALDGEGEDRTLCGIVGPEYGLPPRRWNHVDCKRCLAAIARMVRP